MVVVVSVVGGWGEDRGRGDLETRPCKKIKIILGVLAWFSYLIGKHQLKRTQTGPDRPKLAQTSPNQPTPTKNVCAVRFDRTGLARLVIGASHSGPLTSESVKTSY